MLFECHISEKYLNKKFFQVVVLRHDKLTTQDLLMLCKRQLASLDSSSVPGMSTFLTFIFQNEIKLVFFLRKQKKLLMIKSLLKQKVWKMHNVNSFFRGKLFRYQMLNAKLICLPLLLYFCWKKTYVKTKINSLLYSMFVIFSSSFW